MGAECGCSNNGCVQVVMSGNKGRWGAAAGRYILLREGFICCKSDFESAVQKTQGKNHHESKGRKNIRNADTRMTATDALKFSKSCSRFYRLITPKIKSQRGLDGSLDCLNGI
jgi:hypothetical protein